MRTPHDQHHDACRVRRRVAVLAASGCFLGGLSTLGFLPEGEWWSVVRILLVAAIGLSAVALDYHFTNLMWRPPGPRT